MTKVCLESSIEYFLDNKFIRQEHDRAAEMVGVSIDRYLAEHHVGEATIRWSRELIEFHSGIPTARYTIIATVEHE